MVRTLQVNGSRGEITPLMHSRVDTEFYQAAFARAENVVVSRYGPLMRVPGTVFDGRAKTAGSPTRMLPFEFNDEQIYAIEAGVGKINVNTENQVACTDAIREVLNKDAKVYDPRKYLGPAKNAMVEVVREKIRLFGSSNQA